MSCEEDLVKEQITCDIGESLGLKVSNIKAMITALAITPYQI